MSSEETMIAPILSNELSVKRDPVEVLSEAKKAADALKDVISKKSKPVMMNGEQYLEFEDWQTLARFYGISAKVIDTRFIEIDGAKGFEAKAIAIRSDGLEISRAEAMCLDDEKNWQNKPLFQLRSMSQTRACAKALRNVLAWVVVLAGYKPTPAEEIEEVAEQKSSESTNRITPGQVKLIWARLKASGKTKEELEKFLIEDLNVESIENIPMNKINLVIEFLEPKK